MPRTRVYKRTRADTAESDSSEEIEATSSRRDSSKRVRLSEATSDGSPGSPFDKPQLYARDSGRQGQSPDGSGSEEYELRRDAEFEDLEHQEEDDIRCSQLVSRSFNQTKENKPADNAIIEEIKCINFMCHAKLTVKVGPLINFIIGHNGSGKSAILTALQLCLGGKATSTNRGQSLKSFIKEGQESAMLSVRIKNQGPSAYMPELYGQSIVVERHFSKSGASYFKLKNERDKIVSQKKSDLEDILDAFALQLDNPMNVLTQDMARQFLNHSTAKDKYKFFVKGTQLEQLDHDYRMLEDTLSGLETKLRTREEDIKILEKDFKEAERKSKRASRQDNLRETYGSYARQMAWAQVIEQEKHLAKIDEKIAQADERLQTAIAESEAASTEFDEADRGCTIVQETLQSVKDDTKPLSDEKASLLQDFDKNKSELKGILQQQRDIQSELTQHTSKIARYRKEIDTELRRQADANGGQHAKKLEEIQNARVTSEEARATFTSHSQSAQRVQSDSIEASKRVQAFKPRIEAKRDEVRSKQELIRNLKNNDGQWMSAGTPVGPIGRYVKLKNPEWSPILETQFGAALNAFVVTSKYDQSILADLMKRASYNGNVLIGDPSPIDTGPNEPPSNILTWLRVLTIDNDIVRNQLIIQQAVEQTALIKSRSEAVDYMSRRPNNVRQCFAMHDQKRGEGHRIGFSSAGADRIDPIRAWGKRPRMQGNIASQVNLETEALQQLQEELRSLQNRLAELQSEQEQAQQAVNRHKRENKDLQVQAQRAESRLEQLQDELEAQTPQAGKVETLQRDLQQAEEEKEITQNSFDDAVHEKDKINGVQKELKARLNSLQVELDDANAKIEKGHKKIQTMKERRHVRLLAKNEAISRVDDVRANRVAVEEDREAQVKTVEEYARSAAEFVAKRNDLAVEDISDYRVAVPEDETATSLEKKMERIREEIRKSAQELGGTREELENACVVARNKVTRAKRNFRISAETCESLKLSMMDRHDRWRKFRRYISSRARILFTYLLSERDFRGNLLIDPKNKLLDISIEPDITRNSDKGRQTKTLSGGEKSFSTICLLLSLWEAMGSPIRCLDEFDVFMDNVNRDVSMKMMIAAARRSVGRQYILITPQAMGNVAFADDVKIIKMGDPERGQTALSFAT